MTLIFPTVLIHCGCFVQWNYLTADVPRDLILPRRTFQNPASPESAVYSRVQLCAPPALAQQTIPPANLSVDCEIRGRIPLTTNVLFARCCQHTPNANRCCSCSLEHKLILVNFRDPLFVLFWCLFYFSQFTYTHCVYVLVAEWYRLTQLIFLD